MSIRGAQGSRVSRNGNANSNGNGNRGGIVGLPIGSAPTHSTTIAPDTPYSPQQQTVIDWAANGRGSGFIEAVAGSGKTTVLIGVSRVMRGYGAFAAFNKKIADEIKRKLSADDEEQRNVRVGTFHSFGFAAWRTAADNPRLRVDERAKSRMMFDACEVPWPLRSAVAIMVSIAKQSVVGVLWQPNDITRWRDIAAHFDIMLRVEDDGRSDEDIIDDLAFYAEKCIAWSKSIRRDGDPSTVPDIARTIIDFDDMIWLPLVENSPMHTYDWVLVDEAQDTNAARRMLAHRMLKPGGRLIAVGDRHQAIYGFTGADSNAVDLIIREFNCESMPLTVTFRCSQSATRLAQTWVPHITAHENNEEGSVERLPSRVYFAREDNPVIGENGPVAPLAPGDAILCRNTKPLVSLAFGLIREGVACHVEGRDIGKSLDRLASKWKVDSVTALLANLEAYRQRETERLVARDARYAIEALNDRVDTLMVIAEDCETVQEVRDKIDRMFMDTDGGGKAKTVILSTIHKAKGREWDRVFILGWGVYMPSKWARQAWEREQEGNLHYVAVTRTKRDLILTGAFE